jgi:protein-S-isoprenylcysteine O-methyltransferase Ste14
MSKPFQLLLRIPVPWVFVLTYLIGVVLEYALPLRASNARLPGISVAGGVLFAIGATIAGWGLLTFRRARTTTVPGQASSQLVNWGPYRFSRNPMYVGLIIAYIGRNSRATLAADSLASHRRLCELDCDPP